MVVQSEQDQVENHAKYSKKLQFMKIGEYFAHFVLIPKDATILGSTYQLEVVFLWYDNASFSPFSRCTSSFSSITSRARWTKNIQNSWHIRSKHESAHRIAIRYRHQNTRTMAEKKNNSDSLRLFFSFVIFWWVKCSVVNPLLSSHNLVETFDCCCRVPWSEWLTSNFSNNFVGSVSMCSAARSELIFIINFLLFCCLFRLEIVGWFQLCSFVFFVGLFGISTI